MVWLLGFDAAGCIDPDQAGLYLRSLRLARYRTSLGENAKSPRHQIVSQLPLPPSVIGSNPIRPITVVDKRQIAAAI